MAKILDRTKRGTRTAVIITIVCALLIAGVLIYDAVGAKNAAIRSNTAMGTVVTAKVWGASGEHTAQAVLDRIVAMDEANLSAHNDTSDIAHINSASGRSVKVDNYTANLITRLLLAAGQTNGAFDPTIGALVRLWDIGGPNEQVPTAEEISAARATVDWHQVQVSGDTVQIGKGQALDIGAAGKGAACDAAKEILTENQAKSAVISVGGSILLYGENPAGDDWSVGIRDPRGASNTQLGTLTLKAGQCVSTSGDYERYFEQDGVRYCHILDPRTGAPADSGLISVTVVSPSGLVSDVLSTACFVLGYEQSLPILELFEDAQAVFVTEDRTVLVTPGLAGSFDLTAGSYTLGALS